MTREEFDKLEKEEEEWNRLNLMEKQLLMKFVAI